MTRRERIERRLEKRLEWAESRKQKAADRSQRVHDLLDPIPMGQPILVGHHSERGHRRALEKADNAMRSSIEHHNMAAHHRGKAHGLERMLETTIFSDDEDAVERLTEKLEKLEARRDFMKAANAAYRKGDREKLAELGYSDLDKLREEVQSRYSWEQKGPFPPYALTNIGARIRDAKKRIKQVLAQQARTAAADEAGGVTVEPWGEKWVRVTFAEKPEREILTSLKAAGFRWGGGSWIGPADKLPEEIRNGG